jgi:hypothetical protein
MHLIRVEKPSRSTLSLERESSSPHFTTAYQPRSHTAIPIRLIALYAGSRSRSAIIRLYAGRAWQVASHPRNAGVASNSSGAGIA